MASQEIKERYMRIQTAKRVFTEIVKIMTSNRACERYKYVIAGMEKDKIYLAHGYYGELLYQLEMSDTYVRLSSVSNRGIATVVEKRIYGMGEVEDIDNDKLDRLGLLELNGVDVEALKNLK